jgi:adenylate cyclase
VEAITVLLADDNLIVREGVRALLQRDPSVEVVGVAGDYDELISQAMALCPQVLVTDIRMPPTFQDEGIEGAKEVRKRLPGTGIVVLSQYDSPEYAVSLLSSGAAGYAYLLKDRLADSDQLARAIREVASGGSMLDPEIVQALASPARALPQRSARHGRGRPAHPRGAASARGLRSRGRVHRASPDTAHRRSGVLTVVLGQAGR